MTTAKPLSDAIWTVPNALTFLRLALVPLFLWLALGIEQLGWTVVVGIVGTITDLADGAIARRSGTITKLGTRLDPLSDRLALAAAVAVILIHELAWAPLIWAILIRDLLLVVFGVALVKASGRAIPPVSRLGKRASFAVTTGLGLFLLAGAAGSIPEPNESIRVVAYVVSLIGFAGYVASAVGYVRVARATPAGTGDRNG